jgi:hypothetical protein
MSSEAAFYRLTELVASVMRGNRPMTEERIVRAIHRRAGVQTDRRSVRFVLMSDRRRFSTARSRFTLFWRTRRWRLAEAGPAGDPGNAGAPVPAWPYQPTLSGAAAAPLLFRNDEPPTTAVGGTA